MCLKDESRVYLELSKQFMYSQRNASPKCPHHFVNSRKMAVGLSCKTLFCLTALSLICKSGKRTWAWSRTENYQRSSSESFSAQKTNSNLGTISFQHCAELRTQSMAKCSEWPKEKRCTNCNFLCSKQSHICSPARSSAISSQAAKPSSVP